MTPEEEADARQRELLALYGPTAQDSERIGFPNFEYPSEDQPSTDPLPAQRAERADSWGTGGMAGGPGWLPGLLGTSRTPPTATAVPRALAPQPAPPPLFRPAPGDYQHPVEPRLAMPTQETHTELPPQPPLVLDERVNPPTPTQQQGLEADMVGSMWNDPVALAGYGRDIVRWGEPPIGGNITVLGQYMHPRNARNREEGVADTIRFQPGIPRSSRIDPNWHGPRGMRFGVEGDPELGAYGRHEYRHRGFHNMAQLAQAYGINFDPDRTPGYRDEPMNIFADRALGTTESYPELRFSAAESNRNQADLDYLRSIADQINARRVQQMHDTGISWTQTGRTME